MVFIFINTLIVFFVAQTVKDYRQLSRQLGDVRDENDPMSIGFLEKIFYARADAPDVRQAQRKVVRNATLVALLAVLSRYLYLVA